MDTVHHDDVCAPLLLCAAPQIICIVSTTTTSDIYIFFISHHHHNTTQHNTTLQGGYRVPLAWALSQHGMNVTTMGTLTTGPAYVPAAWTHHEGQWQRSTARSFTRLHWSNPSPLPINPFYADVRSILMTAHVTQVTLGGGLIRSLPSSTSRLQLLPTAFQTLSQSTLVP